MTPTRVFTLTSAYSAIKPSVPMCHLLASSGTWLFQGGGALGAYQAGVYQALAEAGCAPDWLSGISIGAINAAIIAGNEPQVVEGTAPPLYIYADRVDRTGDASA
jgi:hypothetical protein